MPVAPGRNIAILVEVAARNQLLKERGYDAARRFAERVDEMIEARPRPACVPSTAGAGRAASAGGRDERADARRATPRARAAPGATAAPRPAWAATAAASRASSSSPGSPAPGRRTSRAPSRTSAGSAWTTCPRALIPRFAELIRDSAELHRSALVVDMRERDFLKQFPHVFRQLQAQGRSRPASSSWRPRRRCCCAASARRGGRIRWPSTSPSSRASARSARPCAPIRKMADLILDTSDYTVHQLRDYIREHYDVRAEQSPLVVSVMSFGYKYGVPSEADLVFDARFLPNPNFVPAPQAPSPATTRAVVRYMQRQPDTARFLKQAGRLPVLRDPALRQGGQELPHHRHRLHGRPPPLGDDRERRRGDAGPPRAIPVRVRHRDLRQE